MLRRDFLALVAAASVTPAGAQDADAADLSLSREWTMRVDDYVSTVNRAIETKGKSFPNPISADLTRRVYDRVKALQARGWSIERIRALFPFEVDAVKSMIHERQVRVFKIGFGRDGVWFCAGGYSEAPSTWIADGSGARRLPFPSPIQTVGVSKDGRTLAVLTQDRTISLCDPDFTVRAEKAFRLPATFVRRGKRVEAFGSASDADTLIPFDDGQALLVSGSGGQFLLRGTEVTLLDKAGEDNRPDMTHIDLSRDQARIALGSQDSAHYVLDLSGTPLAKLEPISSYPHCAIFNDRIGQVAFNSCHFYNGGTLGLDFGAFDPAGTALGDRGVVELDRTDRVYAGVPYRDGYIWGHAYGYVRHVNRKGEVVWHHHVGGTITWLAINAEETLLAVSTFAGFAVVIDLASAGRNAHAIGSGRFHEPLRYVVTQGEPPLRW